MHRLAWCLVVALVTSLVGAGCGGTPTTAAPKTNAKPKTSEEKSQGRTGLETSPP